MGYPFEVSLACMLVLIALSWLQCKRLHRLNRRQRAVRRLRRSLERLGFCLDGYSDRDLELATIRLGRVAQESGYSCEQIAETLARFSVSNERGIDL